MTGGPSDVGAAQWIRLHSYNVRICHWINLIACGYLVLSGVHIFLDFPELYWGHTGYQGYPAIFRLADWGLSWDEAGALGNRMWGRTYHFTSAWVFLLNGLVYVVWSVYRGHVRERMVPGTDGRYGTLQKLSYVTMIFMFVPLMINGRDLPTGNGAPLRLRVERQCGYKNLKFVKSIQVVDSMAGFGRGTGGINSDFGFHWFAGV